MTKTGYYYKKWLIDDFSFTIYTYNMITDTYDEYKVYNLMTLVGEQTVYGEEIELILSKEPSLRDKKCKIAFSYTLINESTQEKVVKNQNYYYTIYW